MRLAALVVAVGLLLASPLAGQAFPPPPVHRAAPGGTEIGLLGFGVRAGVDFAGRGQLVTGVTLDLGNLIVPRLRIRPSAEIGILNGANTYAGSFELLYHLTDDNTMAMPYAGGGVGLAGHAACGADAACPAVWVNLAVGIALRYRSTFNWILEYHAMDLFRHNRFYIGLTTRRGS